MIEYIMHNYNVLYYFDCTIIGHTNIGNNIVSMITIEVDPRYSSIHLA